MVSAVAKEKYFFRASGSVIGFSVLGSLPQGLTNWGLCGIIIRIESIFIRFAQITVGFVLMPPNG
jgi:hypothetical protein